MMKVLQNAAKQSPMIEEEAALAAAEATVPSPSAAEPGGQRSGIPWGMSGEFHLLYHLEYHGAHSGG